MHEKEYECKLKYNDDLECECDGCKKNKKKSIELSRQGLSNARTTFGHIKYGNPGKTIIKPEITDLPAPKITEENWLFMTGTPLHKKILTPYSSSLQNKKACECEGGCCGNRKRSNS